MTKALEVLFLSQQDVIDAGGKDMRAAIADVSLALSLFDKGDCVLPTKTSLRWGNEESEIETGRINAMPGYIGGSVKMAGIKWLGGSPANPFRFGIPRASGLLILNNPETMVPVAILEAALISAMRTGAVTGAAARHLARPDSRIAGLIGTGVQGHTQLMALKEALPALQEARVYDRDRERLEAFSQEMSAALNMSVVPVEGYREAVEGCDVFVTAIVTNDPVVKNEWVAAGSFYAHIGSHECEFDVVSHSDKVVVDSWDAVVHRDVSTISKMHSAGLFGRKDLYAELGQIENGAKSGRDNPQERILCAPIGFSLHDLVVGTRIYRKAVELGLGQSLDLYDKPVWA
jgi:N-[(2S)-2-amino-2-carboxyethyl]-L-glutamate dehydrogenase